MSDIEEKKIPLLPREDWDLTKHGDDLIAGVYESPPGTVYYVKIPLSELPNDLISLDDLKRFGIDLVNVQSG